MALPPGLTGFSTTRGPADGFFSVEDLAAIMPRDNPAKQKMQAAKAESHESVRPHHRSDGRDSSQREKRHSHHRDDANRKRSAASDARAVEQQPHGRQETRKSGAVKHDREDRARQNRRRHGENETMERAGEQSIAGTARLAGGKTDTDCERQHGFTDPDGKPRVRARAQMGCKGRETRGGTNQHSANARHRGERTGILHRAADEAQVVHRLVVKADGFGIRTDRANGSHGPSIGKCRELCNAKYTSTVSGLTFDSFRSLNPFEFRVELAAYQGHDGDQVHPDQERDAGSDTAVENVVVRNVPNVPAEAEGCQQPEAGGEKCATPDMPPALTAIRAEVVENRRERPTRTEGDSVTNDPENDGETRREGIQNWIDLPELHHAVLNGSAEQDQGRCADHRDYDQEDEHDADAHVRPHGAIAGDVISGVEAVHQALNDAGCGPERKHCGDNDQDDRALAAIAELLEHRVFGARRKNLFEKYAHLLAELIGAHLEGDRRGGSQDRKEREQAGIGGPFRDGEKAVVNRGDKCSSKQPRKLAQSLWHKSYVGTTTPLKTSRDRVAGASINCRMRANRSPAFAAL